MKDNETKLAFIKARAEGKSYSTITKELGIAKATCASWEQALKKDIDALKQANMEELYTSYGMAREARIKALGSVLQRLDSEIAERTLEELPLDKLLDLRLKYGRELKTEYKEPVNTDTDNTLDGLLEQYSQLYNDSKAGEYSPASIKAQLSVLGAMRDTINKIAAEHEREESSKLSFDDFFSQQEYHSRIVRHEERGA